MTSHRIPVGTIQPLLSPQEIEAGLDRIAEAINQQYADSQQLVIVAVLKGSFLFLADLVRRLTMPCQIEFIRLASYHEGTRSTGQVKPVDLTLPSLAGQDVLIVEDIVDTGLTLSFLLDYLQSMHATRSLRTAVLLDKPGARQSPALQTRARPEFVAFELGNEFVVGYGLDYAGLYRNLPYIGVLQLPDHSTT